jgi:hypothetical protein
MSTIPINSFLYIIILLVLLTFAFFVVFLGTEFYFYPYPEIDTFFSSGFSKDNFVKFNKGMYKNKVISLLGEPLSRFSTGYECWNYSGDGKAAPLDFAWISYRVCFDHNRVVSKPVVVLLD